MGPVHAVIAVECSTSTDSGSAEEMTALLGVVRVPPATNSQQVVRLLGLDVELPELGHCEVVNSAPRPSVAMAGLDRVDFLDVGAVTLDSSRRTVRLTRQAFPTVADFISGVVYTNPDLSRSILNGNDRFEVKAKGGSKILGFTVPAQAPVALAQLTLDSVPLAEVERWSNAQASRLQWAAGEPGDVVWAKIDQPKGEGFARCAFRDENGQGTIGAGLLKSGEVSRIVVHRLRTVKLGLSGIDRAQLRIDRAIAHNLVVE